jgi:hypothetical protein
MKEKLNIMKASGLFLLAFCIFFKLNAQQLKPLTSVNSPYNESHAVLSPDGKLFFSVGYHPDNKGGATDPGDIWVSELGNDGIWEIR